MLDDPLSLLSLGVWLMAAGMWPVGFLFGACSACCDECAPECSKCTHYTNNIIAAGQANIISTCTYIHREKFTSLSLQITGVSPVTLENPRGNNPGFCSNPLVVPENLWPIESGSGSAGLCIANYESDDVFDQCGCPLCITFFVLRLEVNATGYQIILDSEPVVGELGPCESDTIAFAAHETLEWEITDFFSDNEEPSPEAVAEAWIPFLNTSGLSGTATIEPCDCGACCDDEQCEDNVAEGGCENWAGVGTSCDDDPDPCAEE
jgi:hypothetical protein